MATTTAPNQPTFAEPIVLLGDCHRRIEKFLDLLIDVTKTTGGKPLSDQSRKDLNTALRYFNQLPPLHNADEEESLFPRLRQMAAGESETAAKARETLSIMDRLEAEHIAAERHHNTIESVGNHWLDNEILSEIEVQLLHNEILSLREFYAEHIALEDNHLFPLAAQLLGQKELESVGREMAARRGVDYDSPDAIHRCARRNHTTTA